MLDQLKQNWKSGITVSLVSIPLSVSLAVASQTSPVVGIITAIWAGIIHSLLGGSNFNIVGPTGALSGILATYALTHGADSLPMVALVAGTFILLTYLFKWEKYFTLIPASAVHGFTLGVAFIIALNQFNFAFGLTQLEKHPHFIENVFESLTHISSLSLPTTTVFFLFLGSLFFMMRFFPKLPGAIMLAPLGIALGYASQQGIIPIDLGTLGEMYPTMTPSLFVPYNVYISKELITTGATIAVIAILETMISAKIADGMTKSKYDRRKEILGLAMANIGAGLAGGIPATAALARTALNVKTGATHKMSATISSIMVALIAFLFLSYFVYIPLAVIAAILVFTAIRMIEVAHYYRMYHHDKVSFGMAFAVAGITIYEDPIIGILVGTTLMLLIFMQKLSKGQFELLMNDEHKHLVNAIQGDEIEKINTVSDTFVYSIKGQLAYINAQAHISRFEMNLAKKYNTVVLRLRELYFIDLDGVDAFDEIVDIIHADGKKVMVTGVNSFIEQMLTDDSETFQDLTKKGLVFDRTADALRSIGFEL